MAEIILRDFFDALYNKVFTVKLNVEGRVRPVNQSAFFNLLNRKATPEYFKTLMWDAMQSVVPEERNDLMALYQKFEDQIALFPINEIDFRKYTDEYNDMNIEDYGEYEISPEPQPFKDEVVHKELGTQEFTKHWIEFERNKPKIVPTGKFDHQESVDVARYMTVFRHNLMPKSFASVGNVIDTKVLKFIAYMKHMIGKLEVYAANDPYHWERDMDKIEERFDDLLDEIVDIAARQERSASSGYKGNAELLTSIVREYYARLLRFAYSYEPRDSSNILRDMENRAGVNLKDDYVIASQRIKNINKKLGISQETIREENERRKFHDVIMPHWTKNETNPARKVEVNMDNVLREERRDNTKIISPKVYKQTNFTITNPKFYNTDGYLYDGIGQIQIHEKFDSITWYWNYPTRLVTNIFDISPILYTDMVLYEPVIVVPYNNSFTNPESEISNETKRAILSAYRKSGAPPITNDSDFPEAPIIEPKIMDDTFWLQFFSSLYLSDQIDREKRYYCTVQFTYSLESPIASIKSYDIGGVKIRISDTKEVTPQTTLTVNFVDLFPEDIMNNDTNPISAREKVNASIINRIRTVFKESVLTKIQGYDDVYGCVKITALSIFIKQLSNETVAGTALNQEYNYSGPEEHREKFFIPKNDFGCFIDCMIESGFCTREQINILFQRIPGFSTTVFKTSDMKKVIECLNSPHEVVVFRFNEKKEMKKIHYKQKGSFVNRKLYHFGAVDGHMFWLKDHSILHDIESNWFNFKQQQVEDDIPIDYEKTIDQQKIVMASNKVKKSKFQQYDPFAGIFQQDIRFWDCEAYSDPSFKVYQVSVLNIKDIPFGCDPEKKIEAYNAVKWTSHYGHNAMLDFINKLIEENNTYRLSYYHKAREDFIRTYKKAFTEAKDEEIEKLPEFKQGVDAVITAYMKRDGKMIHMWSHNGARFDNILLLKDLQHQGHVTNMINSNGILVLEIDYTIVFHDFLRFFNASLDKICNNLLIPEIFSKSDYPYDFVTADTIFHIGDIPSKEFWPAKEDKKGNIYHEIAKDAIAMYEEDGVFDIKKYTEKYAKNDVLALGYAFIRTVESYWTVTRTRNLNENDELELVPKARGYSLNDYLTAPNFGNAYMFEYINAGCYMPELKQVKQKGKELPQIQLFKAKDYKDFFNRRTEYYKTETMQHSAEKWNIVIHSQGEPKLITGYVSNNPGYNKIKLNTTWKDNGKCVKIIKDFAVDRFIRRAIRGGRSTPIKSKFVSKDIDTPEKQAEVNAAIARADAMMAEVEPIRDALKKIDKKISTLKRERLMYEEFQRMKGIKRQTQMAELDAKIKELEDSKSPLKKRDTEVTMQASKEFDFITDYLVVCDATSLYPSAMVNYEYPTGNADWLLPGRDDAEIARIQNDLNNGVVSDKLYIAEVDITHEKRNLPMPLLSTRLKIDGVLKTQYNLLDKPNETFSNVDLEEAVRHNSAKITKIHRILIWESKRYIFRDVVNMFFQERIKAKSQGLDSLQESIKTMLNGFYGYMIKSIVEDGVSFADNSDELDRLIRTRNVNFITPFGDKMRVDYKLTPRQRKINAPSQLGVFILAYSKKLMNSFIAEWGGFDDWEKAIFYTDTDSTYMKAEHYHQVKDLINPFGLKWTPDYNPQTGKTASGKLSQFHDDADESCIQPKVLTAFFPMPKMKSIEYVGAHAKEVYTSHVKSTAKGVQKKDCFKDKKVDNGMKTIDNVVRLIAAGEKVELKSEQWKRCSSSHDVGRKREYSVTKTPIDSKKLNFKPWSGRQRPDSEDRFLPFGYIE